MAVTSAGRATDAATPTARSHPATAAIYQLDGIVRRAPSLQLTADAKRSRAAGSVIVSEGVPA